MYKFAPRKTGISLRQRSADFFCKEPDGKCFRLCGHIILVAVDSVLHCRRKQSLAMVKGVAVLFLLAQL